MTNVVERGSRAVHQDLRDAQAALGDPNSPVWNDWSDHQLRMAIRFFGLNRTEAQEVAQDSMLRIHQALPRLRRLETQRAWRFRILRNVCADFARRRNAIGRHEVSSSSRTDLDDALTLADTSPDIDAVSPEENAMAVELRELIVQEVARIKAEIVPEHVDYILSYIQQDLSPQQLAKLLGCSVGAARVRAHRIRGLIRSVIQEQQGLRP